jgi:uncharacterized protein with HEPN domain
VIRIARARLADIDATIANLLTNTKGRGPADLDTDWAFSQMCHYALQTIGEAANHLPATLHARYPDVPWRKIVGMSHRLRHEYFRIDAKVLWLVITEHLPPFHAAIKRMIAEEDQPGLPL